MDCEPMVAMIFKLERLSIELPPDTKPTLTLPRVYSSAAAGENGFVSNMYSISFSDSHFYQGGTLPMALESR